jgi:16S rRNA (guanine966-N2)-methyltransferase
MRIIAGAFGGRRLVAPRGTATRPTADRVKESLFSILGARCEGARVLDLFAGSGALGLEALSRGSAHVTFVEDAKVALCALDSNIVALGVARETHVVRSSVPRALGGLRGPFDLVFLDPPYGRMLARDTLARLGEAADLLAAGAWVVAEHSRRDVVDAKAARLWRFDERRYGDIMMSFFTTHPTE